MLSFWLLSYLPDKHSCPQQRGIGYFWHWLLISHIQCKIVKFFSSFNAVYPHMLFNSWWKCKFLGPVFSSTPSEPCHIPHHSTVMCFVHCPAMSPLSTKILSPVAVCNHKSPDCLVKITAPHNILLGVAARHTVRLQLTIQDPIRQ